MATFTKNLNFYNIFSNDSNLYIVHHEFKAGKSLNWRDTVYSSMASGGG